MTGAVMARRAVFLVFFVVSVLSLGKWMLGLAFQGAAVFAGLKRRGTQIRPTVAVGCQVVSSRVLDTGHRGKTGKTP